MRIMVLDREHPERLPTKVVVELERQADGSVRATWHGENFRHYIERLPPGVMGDDGKMVEVSTPATFNAVVRNLLLSPEAHVIRQRAKANAARLFEAAMPHEQ